jgi:hypothetical protein
MYINKLEKFLVEATLIDRTNDQTIDISSFIHSINVKKNYVTNSFPLFVINIMTTEQVRNIMRDNEISINLKVDKYSDSDSETSEDSDEIPVIEERIINTTIRIYEKPFVSTNTFKEEDDEESDSFSDVIQTVPYQLTGIPEELIKKNDKIINEVYHDIKINNALVNILSKVEKNEIYIDNSDNKRRYDSLLVPPLNLIPAIKHIQSNFGIYASPIGIFFDMNKTYLYKLFNKNRENSTTVEIITVKSNDIGDDNKFITPLVDENRNVRVYLKNTPDFESFTKINDDILGRTTVINSYDYNFDLIRRIYEHSEVEGDKVRYYWNEKQDKIFEDEFINENKQASEGTTITLSNIDPNYFNIDTLYTLTTSTPYANGNYELVENSFSFFTSDYTHYNSIVNIKLAKLK